MKLFASLPHLFIYVLLFHILKLLICQPLLRQFIQIFIIEEVLKIVEPDVLMLQAFNLINITKEMSVPSRQLDECSEQPGQFFVRSIQSEDIQLRLISPTVNFIILHVLKSPQ